MYGISLSNKDTLGFIVNTGWEIVDREKFYDNLDKQDKILLGRLVYFEKKAISSFLNCLNHNLIDIIYNYIDKDISDRVIIDFYDKFKFIERYTNLFKSRHLNKNKIYNNIYNFQSPEDCMLYVKFEGPMSNRNFIGFKLELGVFKENVIKDIKKELISRFKQLNINIKKNDILLYITK